MGKARNSLARTTRLRSEKIHSPLLRRSPTRQLVFVRSKAMLVKLKRTRPKSNSTFPLDSSLLDRRRNDRRHLKSEELSFRDLPKRWRRKQMIRMYRVTMKLTLNEGKVELLSSKGNSSRKLSRTMTLLL